jgi:hypothetical protein
MGMGSGGNYSDKQSQRLEEVPELEQWNREFWRPKRSFFQKTGNSRPKSESSTSGLGHHSKIRGQVTPTSRRPHLRHAPACRTIARPLDQAVSVVSPLLAGPVHSILRPSLRSVGRFPSAWGTPHSLAPRVELGLSTSSETSSL